MSQQPAISLNSSEGGKPGPPPPGDEDRGDPAAGHAANLEPLRRTTGAEPADEDPKHDATNLPAQSMRGPEVAEDVEVPMSLPNNDPEGPVPSLFAGLTISNELLDAGSLSGKEDVQDHDATFELFKQAMEAKQLQDRQQDVAQTDRDDKQ